MLIQHQPIRGAGPVRGGRDKEFTRKDSNPKFQRGAALPWVTDECQVLFTFCSSFISIFTGRGHIPWVLDIESLAVERQLSLVLVGLLFSGGGGVTGEQGCQVADAPLKGGNRT